MESYSADINRKKEEDGEVGGARISKSKREMELWEKIRAWSLGSCDRWSSWISCLSLCDLGCCGHFVCSNSTMDDSWERNHCFPTRFSPKKSQVSDVVFGDLCWWQIVMLIKYREERGAESVRPCYDAVSFVVTEMAKGKGKRPRTRGERRLQMYSQITLMQLLVRKKRHQGKEMN